MLPSEICVQRKIVDCNLVADIRYSHDTIDLSLHGAHTLATRRARNQDAYGHWCWYWVSQAARLVIQALAGSDHQPQQPREGTSWLLAFYQICRDWPQRTCVRHAGGWEDTFLWGTRQFPRLPSR